MYPFPNLEQVYCSMSSSNCCFLTCIQISQEAGRVVWYSHLFQNFPQFVVIHTVKVKKAMAPHSSTLAWKIPWTEEPGRLQSMGSLRVWHNWATSLSLFTFMHWRKKWLTHSSTLAWRIPGMGEPGGLPSMGSHRVRRNWSDLAAAAYSQKLWHSQ